MTSHTILAMSMTWFVRFGFMVVQQPSSINHYHPFGTSKVHCRTKYPRILASINSMRRHDVRMLHQNPGRGRHLNLCSSLVLLVVCRDGQAFFTAFFKPGAKNQKNPIRPKAAMAWLSREMFVSFQVAGPVTKDCDGSHSLRPWGSKLHNLSTCRQVVRHSSSLEEIFSIFKLGNFIILL